ncbi:MAG: hypothetical protein GX620_18190 [Chloroflexi bacterium]|nr:hypothetical protein [Chloroflexota bacterium]
MKGDLGPCETGSVSNPDTRYSGGIGTAGRAHPAYRTARRARRARLARTILLTLMLLGSLNPVSLGGGHTAVTGFTLPQAPLHTRDGAGPEGASLDGTAGNRSLSRITYANCRFGVGQVYYSILSYDVTSLNLGWYLNWGSQTNPPRPNGMEYAQVLRVSAVGHTPSSSILATRVAANPGALWIIGNEPDCIYQDSVTPEQYAQVYHDAYTFIKSQDATARVAAGGIVQPTPLRIAYLDRVLQAYATRYGDALPADAWNIHSFILREASCAVDPDDCWGAEIPPGMDVTHGELYSLDDTDRVDIFEARIVSFREWMRDRGYRNTPLIISEFGTLLPYYNPESLYYDADGRAFDADRAASYLATTMDFLRTATDSATGYPPDANRLVQRWLWYSLDDTGYGGALFDPYTPTHPMLALGETLADITSGLTPTVDLVAVDVGQVGPAPLSLAGTVTLTLRARVSNAGNVPVEQPITVRFLDGTGQRVGPDQVSTAVLQGCATVREITTTWPHVAPGSHTVQVIVDPANTIVESRGDNNVATGTVLVARTWILLPLVTRRGK